MQMVIKKGCDQWAEQPGLMGPLRSHLTTPFLYENLTVFTGKCKSSNVTVKTQILVQKT